MVKVTGFDHIVLLVGDVEKSLAFYMGDLGMAADADRMAQWRRGEVRFPSVRVNEQTIIDLVPMGASPQEGHRNLGHYCLIVEAERIEDVAAELQARGVAIVREAKLRSGAQGDGLSISVQDPDGNEIELRTYAPVTAPSAAAARAR